MAFMLHSTDDGRIPSIEYLPCSAITPKAGMALTQSSGNLAIASGTTKPAYISMMTLQSACTAGDIIPVFRVDPDMIFETAFSASASGVDLGEKVTIASDGLRVTATESSGVAEVVYKAGSASGDMCRVRFS